MFGIGGRSFTHQIANRTGLDYDTAEAVKLQIGGVSLDQLTLMHRDETVAEAERRNEIQTILSTPERAKKINEAISDNIEVWLGGVAVALEDFPLIEA